MDTFEVLFRIIKSGYKAEKVQFEDGSALMNWAAMCLMMAVRLLHLLKSRDVDYPDSALPYFSEAEIEYLEYQEPLLISEKSTVHRPERRSLAWAIQLLAVMGGYKLTPSSKPPGQMSLWRGLSKLEIAASAWEAAKKHEKKRKNMVK